MGGIKGKIINLSLGIMFIPQISLSNTVPKHIVKNIKDVEIIPISREESQKYSYNKNEFWLNNTNIVNNFSVPEATQFYTNLLETIENNYIYDMPYEKMVNYVLDGLSSFSDKLSVTIANNRLLIHDKNLTLVGNYSTPFEGDAQAWANLIVNIILHFREKYPSMQNAHPEQIYYITAVYLLQSLDENSKYTDNISLQKKQKGYNSNTLGFSYRRIPNGIQVLSIINESPVYFSKIAEGDVITHINSIPVTKLTDENIESVLTNNDSSIVHLNYISYITNKQNSEYLKRNIFIAPSLFVNKTNPEIPVISISNFKQKSSYELKDAIDGLNKDKLKGVIIDVRANNGGDFTESLEMANLFISGGEILKTKGLGEDKNQIYTAKSGDILKGKPIIILADHSTKAEAEMFAFILQSAGRAVLVGAPTFGNGSVHETFTLPNKAQIEFTTKQAISPNGYMLSKVGVIPLVCASSFSNEASIDIFVKNVETGIFKDNRERFSDTPKDSDVKRIRKSCPSLYPITEAQELPVKIATKIIENEKVYNKLKSMKY